MRVLVVGKRVHIVVVAVVNLVVCLLVVGGAVRTGGWRRLPGFDLADGSKAAKQLKQRLHRALAKRMEQRRRRNERRRRNTVPENEAVRLV